MAEDKVRAHVFVRGKVQGVYFRQNTQIVAKQHGVFGWVRNLDDGRVEAILEGVADKVSRVVEWCHKGPPAARVDDLQVSYEKYTGEFSDFEVTG
ncbi:MAG: acylphosphatase [Nitrososphaera sp.]|nr:acylphosphatase [Nitrososphaera sp.]